MPSTVHCSILARLSAFSIEIESGSCVGVKVLVGVTRVGLNVGVSVLVLEIIEGMGVVVLEITAFGDRVELGLGVIEGVTVSVGWGVSDKEKDLDRMYLASGHPVKKPSRNKRKTNS